jgi:hypothetical protein
MRLAAVILCVATVTACTEVQQVADNTARKGAAGVVTEVLATRFPQVPKELISTFSDCLIANSTADEVQEYVKAAVRGVDDGTVNAVRTALARPETRTCAQQKALSGGLLG